MIKIGYFLPFWKSRVEELNTITFKTYNIEPAVQKYENNRAYSLIEKLYTVYKILKRKQINYHSKEIVKEIEKFGTRCLKYSQIINESVAYKISKFIQSQLRTNDNYLHFPIKIYYDTSTNIYLNPNELTIDEIIEICEKILNNSSDSKH